MRINFERTGGFMGMHLAVEVTTETLPPAEANELETLVDSAHFFDLPSSFKPSTGGADRYQYKLTVERGDQFHTVETSESATPENLQPLIEHLTKVARSRRFI
jgi:Emfourin